MLNRYSLRRSIPALLGLFAIVFAALLILIQLPISQKNALNSWRNYTDHMLIQLQSSLNNHLLLNRSEEMATELAELGSLPNIKWAAVVDSQLQSLSSTRLGLEASIYSQLSQQSLSELINTHAPTWRLTGKQSYLAIYPLNRMQLNAQDQTAALLVELDFAPLLRQTTNNAWLYLGQALLLLCALGLVLNRLYFHLVVQRIAHIATVTQRYGAGNLKVRTALQGHDEISQLGTAINSMLIQLEDSHSALQDSEHMLRSLLSAAPIGLLVLSEQQRIIDANPAAQTLFKMSQAELLATDPAQLFNAKPAWQQLLVKINASVLLNITEPASTLSIDASISTFSREQQRFKLVLLNDISERKQAEQRLHYLANYDILTGLANRNNMISHIAERLKNDVTLSLIMLDLDRFQYLNDGLGHNIGDQLLKAVAKRLQEYSTDDDVLARIGGDEFMLALHDTSVQEVEQLAQRMLDAFKKPFQVLQYELYITASIGIAHQHEHSNNPIQLFNHADLALRQAKKISRNCFITFDSDLISDAALRQQLTDELRYAISNDEFELLYQPQVDLSGRPIAMEALLRWRSPSHGPISPSQFIPLLEETGMILDVSRWVFRTACRQASAWYRQGTPLRIAVNLSPLDFLQADLTGSLLQIMQEEQTPVQLIELEVTESSLLDAGAQVQTTLKQLKAAGLLMFLDDFGTGYSSLSYIKRFEFDGIKIDQEFVSGLPDCQQSIALVQGILSIAAHLNLEVVAEGVETAEQVAFLRQLGCQRLQGYYFSPAQAAEQHFSRDKTLKHYSA
ncbi:MAG: EAL domain-containing protein [Pseudomonas sp.]|jgi:diguanylate cyclase (GGDEF)-like protein|nr:EAL domain-containing protein [Pseudomonas sp.]NLO54766.1 EAL domain-containing protein [Gammaproteobacteria bacterium]